MLLLSFLDSSILAYQKSKLSFLVFFFFKSWLLYVAYWPEICSAKNDRQIPYRNIVLFTLLLANQRSLSLHLVLLSFLTVIVTLEIHFFN